MKTFHTAGKWPLRLLLLAGLAVGAMVALPALAEEQRISVEQFSKDPKKVEALRKGITKMRADSEADPTSAKYRTSFAYWANTHGYFGTGGNATDLKAYIAYRMPQCLSQYPKATCDAYFAHMKDTTVPNDGITADIWGTCQHGNLFFLPWHRIYLHYFERTVRKQSGDAEFALPYWNYFNNYIPAKKGICLPPLVRGKEAGTLFNQYRTPGLNENTSFMDPTEADATQAFSYTDFTSFSNQLQNQPHGAMHCAVGSGCTMPDIGFVPIAGNDPVFYMHHANIDRLWQCWMVRKAKGQTIDLAWAKANLGMNDAWFAKTYSFVDEDGNKVTRSVADVFNGTIKVNYDNLTNCDAKPTAPTKATQPLLLATQIKTQALVGAKNKILLGNASVDVKLQPPAGLNAPAPTGDATPGESDVVREPGQTYLVLSDVNLVGSPALTYKVILVNKANPKKTSYVATLNFFGLGPVGHHDHTGSPDSLGTLTYKVSANLAELGVTDTANVVVRFVPTNLLVGAKLKTQKEGNGVEVSAIRLETAPAAAQ